jgi:acyl-CoA thioesterase
MGDRVAELDDLLAVLRLEEVGERSYRAQNAQLTGGSVVFGGQLLAQSIVAGGLVDPTKDVKSIHTIFSKGASLDQPLEIDVDVMATGRAFASSSVTIRQGDRICTRSLVLLSAAEPDLIRHQDDPPPVAPPSESTPSSHGTGFWDIATVGGVDISDPDAVGPAELRVWTRFPGAPDDPTTSRALLAFASDGFLIGAAMRPHEGVGQSMAHVSISTTVVTHTLSFHEPFDAGDWLLMDQRSPYAGRGRSYGRADVYSSDGRYVASFAQENMIRDFPESQRPAAGQRSAH